MPRLKPTSQDLEKREERARVWRQFRKDYLFTQKRLADIVGISRRTVQQIEAGTITPQSNTLRLFLVIKKKHETHGDV